MSSSVGTKRALSPAPESEPEPSRKRTKTGSDAAVADPIVSPALPVVKSATSASKKNTVTRLSPRKPRKHVKRGAWRRMVEMPYEVLDKIFSYMTPRELLRLSRVDKAIRCSILTVWNPRAFISARENFHNAPPPPEGMSEPEYASYICEKVCSMCGGSAALVDPVLRVRACAKHLREVAVVLNKDYHRHLGVQEYEDNRVPTFQDLMRCVPYKSYNNRNWANIRDVRGLVHDWRNVGDDSGDAAYYAPHHRYPYGHYRDSGPQLLLNERAENKPSSRLWDDWRARIRGSRTDVIAATVEQRQIITRLLDMGCPEVDLEFNAKFPMNNEWSSLCFQPEPITDEHWARIWPQIQVIMTARQKARCNRQKQEAKVNRRDLVERSMLGVMHEDLERGAWRGDGTKRNVMKPLLHAVVPHIDIMALARTFVKGHTSKPPSHQAVIADTQSATSMHLLRVRACLARMVRTTDDLRTSTQPASRTVTLGSDVLGAIETSVEKMTIEQLRAGDEEAVRILFHPAAFFRPRHAVELSKLSSEDPTPEYLKKDFARSDARVPYSLREVAEKFMPDNPLSYHSKTLGGRTTVSCSTKSFYPAVFKDSKRPPHTSVKAREVQVDIALRETAVWLLKESEAGGRKLNEDDVMQMALSNAMCFSCLHCGKCKVPKYAVMTWTQLVAHYADLLNRRPNPIDLLSVPPSQDRAEVRKIHQVPSIRMYTHRELSNMQYVIHKWHDTAHLAGPHGFGCPCKSSKSEPRARDMPSAQLTTSTLGGHFGFGSPHDYVAQEMDMY